MKLKTIAILVLLLGLFTASAQTVNDTPINEINTRYVQIVATQKYMSNKMIITLDFGQQTKFFSSGKNLVILDKQGKTIEFNSIVDALNFMSENGYYFIQAYINNNNGNAQYHYLLENTNYSPEK